MGKCALKTIYIIKRRTKMPTIKDKDKFTKDIMDLLYSEYASMYGNLFGIPSLYKSGVEAVVRTIARELKSLEIR